MRNNFNVAFEDAEKVDVLLFRREHRASALRNNLQPIAGFSPGSFAIPASAALSVPYLALRESFSATVDFFSTHATLPRQNRIPAA
jgi:hypothetical protein